MAETPPVARDEETRMVEVRDRLRQRFPDLDHQLVTLAVFEAHHELDGATIRDFLPILVENRARDLLEHARR